MQIEELLDRQIAQLLPEDQHQEAKQLTEDEIKVHTRGHLSLTAAPHHLLLRGSLPFQVVTASTQSKAAITPAHESSLRCVGVRRSYARWRRRS